MRSGLVTAQTSKVKLSITYIWAAIVEQWQVMQPNSKQIHA